ncbi:MAG: alpha/beta hydrolase [Candidatus Woesearchaeota archaeon]
MKKDNLFINIIMTILVTILVFLSVVYFLQDDAIFVKQSMPKNRVMSLRSDPSIKEVNLTIKENRTIRGWFLNQTNSSGTVIYFGGNAEEVSWILDRKEEFREWNVLTFNYRGYGLSEGIPTEENLKEDSIEIYDSFKLKDSEKVIIKGRSIGTSIAIHLASKRNVSGLVLISPFDNLKSIIKETIPFPKITHLIKYDFNLIKDSKNLNIPMMTIIAEKDDVIPKELSMTFYNQWEGKKEIQTIKGFGHNDLQYDQKYWDSIKSFLKKFE